MKRMAFALVTLAGLAWAASASAAPQVMSYQGRLRTSQGEPVTTPVTLTFSFHATATGGAPLAGFSDADTLTPDADGRYETQIGDLGTLPIPARVFSTPETYLNVNVNGEDLTPRRLVTPVGVALESSRSRSTIVDRTVAAGQTVQAGDVVWQMQDGTVRKGANMVTQSLLPNAFRQLTRLSTTYAVLHQQGAIHLIQFQGRSAQIVQTVTATDISAFLCRRINDTQWLEGFTAGGGIRLNLRIGTRTGNTMSWEAPVQGELADMGNMGAASLAVLDPNTFVLLYPGVMGGNAYVGSINGSTVALGPNLGLGSVTCMGRLSSNRIIAFQAGPSNYVASVGTVSGNTLTLGLNQPWDSKPNGLGDQSIVPLGDDEGLVASNSRIQHFTISGNTITFGEAVTWNGIGKATLAATGNGTFLLGGSMTHAGQSAARAVCATLTWTGSQLNLGKRQLLGPGTVTPLGLMDGFPALATSLEPAGVDSSLVWPLGSSTLLGVAADNATAGQSLPIDVMGVSSAASGLTPGAEYFSTWDGTLTTQAAVNFMGSALSSNELLIKDTP